MADQIDAPSTGRNPAGVGPTADDAGLPAEIINGDRSRDLRRAVLRPGLPVDAPLPGDEYPEAIHFGVVAPQDGRVLSTCFLFSEACPWRPDDRPAWHLRQMATDPDHRGHGHGAAVLHRLVDYIDEHGGGTLWCNARDTAVGFYERSGFAGYGEIFVDGVHAIPHLHMWRRVP